MSLKKVCGECCEELPVEEFPTTMKTIKKLHLHPWCRTCKNKHQKLLTKLHRENPNPPPGTPCAICRRIDVLVLDHSHWDDSYRGHICRNCILGCGLLGDSAAAIERAFLYLSKAEDASRLRALRQSECETVTHSSSSGRNSSESETSDGFRSEEG